MERVASRRLIEASASLSPEERALLNLWLNHGLDDQALGRMSGFGADAIARRRSRLVARLSAQLGLPPADVEDELRALAQPTTQPERAPAEPIPEPPPKPEALGPSPEDPPAPTATPAPGAERRSRRRLLAWPALALAALAAGVVIIAATGAGATRHRAPHRRESVSTTSTRSASTPTAPTDARTPARVAPPAVRPLVVLPGGLSGARGEVVLIGPMRHLKLRLRVRGLPRPHDGSYYEVWLYNSIIDSVPLGKLRPRRRHQVVPLPRHAGRYRWIDISFQLPGEVNPSGVSVLRAANPARATRRQLRRRSARRRQLRRATRSSSRASTSK